MTIRTILLTNLLLSALSITNLGLISSMVAFLHDQEDNVDTYTVSWPNHHVALKVVPEHLWTDHGHESNGVAGYGFFLGLFGMYVAWRQREGYRRGKPPSKSLLALAILLILAVLFTLSAIIFVFVVTYRTNNQSISSNLAFSNIPYSHNRWTPETWFKAVLELPLADGSQRDDIDAHVLVMEAWRWMLIPIFVVDLVALVGSVREVRRQRRGKGSGEDLDGK